MPVSLDPLWCVHANLETYFPLGFNLPAPYRCSVPEDREEHRTFARQFSSGPFLHLQLGITRLPSTSSALEIST